MIRTPEAMRAVRHHILRPPGLLQSSQKVIEDQADVSRRRCNAELETSGSYLPVIDSAQKRQWEAGM